MISPRGESDDEPDLQEAQRKRVVIFDTTMRDGEHSLGVRMSVDQKLRLAQQLEALRVDVVEAGFPGASDNQFEAVRQVAATLSETIVCGISRPNQADIERCGEALKHAKRPRIHIVISTSRLHMRWEQRLEPDQVLETTARSIMHARNLTDDVEWTASDATRADHDFLRRCVDVAIRAGATTINLPDTVGYSHPPEYGNLFRNLIATVPGAEMVTFSTHCHNDLGLAAANSLEALAGGARQVQCTINGIGERAGNAALEEVVMAIKVRGDQLPFYTDVDTRQLGPTSRLVAEITGFPVAFNKTVVGRNAFSHASPIPLGALEGDRKAYEIMGPADVGWAATRETSAERSQ
jgi:2-isopropylmalate synthase